MMTNAELRALLDESYERFNTPDFIQDDPIIVPHQFSKKEDIEIAAFFAATLAWGQRPQIIRSSMKLMQMMDDDPYNFITSASKCETRSFANFVHRTFNGEDCISFINSLKNIYNKHDGLEGVFTNSYIRLADMKNAIAEFHKIFFELLHSKRTEKHVSDSAKNSACKRINLFLRWMVRDDRKGVDFGLWKGIPASALFIPLDLHTGNTSRALGLLTTKQNNWKAVEELTQNLRRFDADDPVKYDFALFGLGRYDNIC
jgi:uncharacterized protein (TIGR02757 family)